MIKKISVLTAIFLVALSCNHKNHIETKYSNGNIKVRAEVNNNSVYDGSYEEFYLTGELKMKTNYINGICSDTVYIYYKNKQIKEKGIMKNSIKDGWWSQYNEAGILVRKIEFLPKRKNVINQLINFDLNGDTITNSSRFYRLYIADTLKVGKNVGQLKYNSDSKIKDKFYKVIINNQISENRIDNDTFPEEHLITRYGIYAHKKGYKVVNGTILETIMETHSIGSDSLEMKEIKREIFFSKRVYIKSDKT